jgi:hypothetical protein
MAERFSKYGFKLTEISAYYHIFLQKGLTQGFADEPVKGIPSASAALKWFGVGDRQKISADRNTSQNRWFEFLGTWHTICSAWPRNVHPSQILWCCT